MSNPTPETTPPATDKKGLFDFLFADPLAKTVTLVLGALFAIGYFVNSYYFSGLGIDNLSPLRLQHILTGADFIFFLCAPGLLLFAPWRLGTVLACGKIMGPPWLPSTVRKALHRTWLARSVLYIAFYIIFTLLLNGLTNLDSLWGQCWTIYFPLGRPLINDDPVLFMRVLFLLWLVLFNAALFFSIWRVTEPLIKDVSVDVSLQSRQAGNPRYWLAVLSLAVGMLCGGYYYTTTVHPWFSASYGGASYGFYDLQLKSNEKSDKTSEFFTKDGDASISQVWLIYEDEKSIYYSKTPLSGGRIVVWRIKMEEVMGTRYDSQKNTFDFRVRFGIPAQ